MEVLLLLFSVLQDTKKKIQKMKDYQNRLMETLADVLAEHFPLPTQETNADKKKKVAVLVMYYVALMEGFLNGHTQFFTVASSLVSDLFVLCS